VPTDWVAVGLWHYTCNDPSTRTFTPQEEPVPVSKKQAKKQEQKERHTADLGGEQLLILPLSTSLINSLPFMPDLENLVGGAKRGRPRGRAPGRPRARMRPARSRPL
jgi:hypothetical protein